MHPEGQVVEAHSLIVAVYAPRLGLTQWERRQAVAHDAQASEVMAIREAGEGRRGDERIGRALARRGHDGAKQLRLGRALGGGPVRALGSDLDCPNWPATESPTETEL